MTQSNTPIDRIEDLQIEQELQDSYLTYAMSTIMDRALPDVRDGLKPSQRRILVAMNDLNLGPRAQASQVREDRRRHQRQLSPARRSQVVYPTLVRLAQDWNLRYTLIDGQGNFGSTDGDPPAAMRYTEARMTAIGDGAAGRPGAGHRRLPAQLRRPADGADGAAGQVSQPAGERHHGHRRGHGVQPAAAQPAGNLRRHRPCDGQPRLHLADLLEIVPGPDFPTGGMICGRDGIIEGYKSGRGRVTLRAKVEVEEQKEREADRRHRGDPLRRHPPVDRRVGRRGGEEGFDQGHFRRQRSKRPAAQGAGSWSI